MIVTEEKANRQRGGHSMVARSDMPKGGKEAVRPIVICTSDLTDLHRSIKHLLYH